jgi:hypothetical protein
MIGPQRLDWSRIQRHYKHSSANKLAKAHVEALSYGRWSATSGGEVNQGTCGVQSECHSAVDSLLADV